MKSSDEDQTKAINSPSGIFVHVFGGVTAPKQEIRVIPLQVQAYQPK
jgi:hypothetical protein